MPTKRRDQAAETALPVKLQRRMAVVRPAPEGVFAIRIYHRSGRMRGTGRILPRYLLRCGCCQEKLEIYYDAEGPEINGVNGSLENWREILLPLLRITQPKKERRSKVKVAARSHTAPVPSQKN